MLLRIYRTLLIIPQKKNTSRNSKQAHRTGLEFRVAQSLRLILGLRPGPRSPRSPTLGRDARGSICDWAWILVDARRLLEMEIARDLAWSATRGWESIRTGSSAGASKSAKSVLDSWCRRVMSGQAKVGEARLCALSSARAVRSTAYWIFGSPTSWTGSLGASLDELEIAALRRKDARCGARDARGLFTRAGWRLVSV
jgi:hypothetical protein